MIQDIAPHQFKNEYRPVSPQKDSIALYYEEHTALMGRTQTGIEFPTFGELERLNEEIYENSIYLFTIDEKQYYLVDNLNREPHSEFTMENTEIFRTADPQYSAFAGITGYQLYRWYQTRRYCGRLDIRCVMIQKRGCFSVNTAEIWNFRRSVRLSLLE